MKKSMVALIFAVCVLGMSSTAFSYQFTAAGGWYVDWGLEIVLDNGWGADPGKHLDWTKSTDGGMTWTALSAGNTKVYGSGPTTVYYTLEDYLASDTIPIGGELYDAEALLITGDDNYWYVLGVTSFPDHTTVATFGDLAVNPNYPWVDGPAGPGVTGNNTADLGIKLAGKNVGAAETDAIWGYGLDNSDAATTDYRNPMTDHGANPGGKTPSQADGWGSNYVWGTGATVASGVEATGVQKVFSGGDGKDGAGLSTYAWAAKISKSVATVNTATWGESCLNDSITVHRTPEPATAALLLCSVAGLVLRRVRRHMS